MKGYLFILTNLFIYFQGYAQNTGAISGRIVDENRQPLPGAVVRLIAAGDSAATATDSNGVFALKGIKSGSYLLHISFTGYSALDNHLLLSEGKPANLGNLQLKPATAMLKEVQVTARRNFMTVENDKKVFYPNSLGGVASGSAGDVMQQIPMVDMDKDGNITLRGKTPQVLIDGKPSPYSDISTALQMISATAIEKIEVMTNPSAKYDADGQGGVLNIVLKKDKADGFNGMVNLDFGSYPDNHIGTDFNYRKKKLNFFGNINYHHKQVKATQTSNQHFLQRDSRAYVNQQSNSTVTHKDIDSRFGLDYFISDRSSLTLTQGFSKRVTDNYSAIDLDSDSTASTLNQVSSGYNQTHSTDQAYNTDLNFTHHFSKDGDLLTADLIHNYSQVKSNMNLDNPALFVPAQIQQNTGASSVNSWILQTDYSGNIGKKGKLEAGYKGSITDNQDNVNAQFYDDTINNYAYDQALSSRFKYKEQIHALYTTYADSIFGLHYKLGLRSELARLQGDSYLQGIDFSKSFFNLFPSLYLSKDLADDQSIGISYASRISRPSFAQLLPYINMTNPVNWQSGNLDLRPAYTQNVEFNYSKLFTQSNDFLNVSLYYMHTSNSIQMVTVNEPGGYALTTPQNIAADKAIGSDLIYRFNIHQAVNFTTTFDVSYNKFSGSTIYTGASNGFWNYRLNLEGSLNLTDKFIFLAHGELTGPRILPQGHMNENKGIDIELKRQFFNKKITASAIVSDIFYDRRNTAYIITPAFIENDIYRENSRMLHIHLSYGF